MKRRQPECDGWTWAAAAACELRRAEVRPTGWGAGDQVAETLVLRAEGADASAGRALRRALGGDPPAREAQWAAMADELWTRLGLRTEFGDLVPGRTVDSTPWHMHLETEPGAPHFHRRALAAADEGLAAALVAAGRNLRPLIALPRGRLAPVLVAGRRRTVAARHAVGETLAGLVVALAEVADPYLVPPPHVLGLPRSLDSVVNSGKRPESVRLLGLLRVEIVAADSELAAWAVNGDNDLQRPETPMSQARQVENLRRMGHTLVQIGQMKGLGPDSAANLASLLRLTEEMQDLLEEGALDLSEAYRLARVEAGRQREIYEATRGVRPVTARIAAIAHMAAGEPVSTAVARPAPVPRAAIVRACAAIRELRPRPPESAESGARAVLRLLGGDETGLATVPPSCREEIRSLLGLGGDR